MSCLIPIAAMTASFAVGVIVGVCLTPLMGQHNAGCIGTGVWLLSFFTSYGYASLWIRKTEEDSFQALESSWTANRRRRNVGKWQTAEFRIGYIFLSICGAMAYTMQLAPWQIALVAVVAALVGGLIGHDLKRRKKRLEEVETRENA